MYTPYIIFVRSFFVFLISRTFLIPRDGAGFVV